MSISIKKMFMTKKVVVVGAAVAVALGAGTAAFAYFTSTGSGTGSASTGSAAAVAITDNSAALSSLLPGAAAQDLTVTATAPSTQSAYVSGITGYVTVVENSTVAAAYPSYTCSSADYLLDGVAGSSAIAPVTITGWTAQDLAKGASASTSSGNTIQFNDLTTVNQDACQGATVTINYSSN